MGLSRFISHTGFVLLWVCPKLVFFSGFLYMRKIKRSIFFFFFFVKTVFVIMCTEGF